MPDPRFARRTAWEFDPDPLGSLAERLRVRGELYDLTESNPTRCGFHYEDARIRTALADARNLLYAPDPRGQASARAAVQAYYQARRIDLDPGRIWLTASTSEAYSHLFRLLADAGERVHAPQPGYPLFELLAGQNDLELAAYKLHYDGGAWELDWESLESAWTPQSRLVLLLNPNNPTGAYLRAGEWPRLQAWAAERGLALVVDEVFFDYAFAPDPNRLCDCLQDATALTFVLSGLSKVAALPQMKLGWIVLAGPAGAAAAAIQRLEMILDIYLSVAAPVQNAATELLATAPAIQAQIRARTLANLRELDAGLSASPEVTRFAVEGGWYATLRLPRHHDDETWARRLLEQDSVYLHPGHFYGFSQEGCAVVSLLPREPDFREGIRRLLERVRQAS